MRVAVLAALLTAALLLWESCRSAKHHKPNGGYKSFIEWRSIKE